jgi:hypothetical protein
MTANSDIIIEVKGYVAELLCGSISLSAKRTFTDRIIRERDLSLVPEWLKRRSPDYVGSEEIKNAWYGKNSSISGTMNDSGLPWKSYREVNDLCHIRGFGSGKGDIGLFEIIVRKGQDEILRFVPLDPSIETGQALFNMGDVGIVWLDPEPLPLPGEGCVAVSAGSWAMGTMLYPVGPVREFAREQLEIPVRDMTNLGIGEDHFVTGLRYEGEDLTGAIVRERDREYYQVSWYSPEKGRWLDMYESG